MKTKILHKPILESVNNICYVKKLLANGNLAKDTVVVTSRPPGAGIQSLAETVIIDEKLNKFCGSHYYSINPKTKVFEGDTIRTDDLKRHQGYGELLRLVSIIHMQQNKLELNSIDSLSTAVPFHYKYGFRPDFEHHKDFQLPLKTNQEFEPIEFIMKILDLLSVSKGQGTKFKKDVNFLRKKVNTKKTLLKKDMQKLDSLVNRYIVKHLKHWSEDLFIDGLPMSLSKNYINKHTDFFNNLFKKHGINYTITKIIK